MEPILFNDLDEAAQRRALEAYKETVYPELLEGYGAEGLVEQVGPFTDDDSLLREIRTLGIVFSNDGTPVTDGDLLYIAYKADSLELVHVSVNDIRNFKPHYLRYIARNMDRSIL